MPAFRRVAVAVLVLASAAAVAPSAGAAPATNNISTVAGTGTGGFSGDGGPAASAKLADPVAVVPTPGGGFLITDQGNQRVRRVSPSGVITTIAGTGSAGYNGDNILATNAKLNDPEGVAELPDGSILIADSGNHRVRRIASGMITTVAGDATAGNAGDGSPATSANLTFPSGLSVRSDGTYLIADYGTETVRQVTPGGIISTVAGNGTAGYTGDGGSPTLAELNDPRDVSFMTDGGFVVAERINMVVRRVSGGTPTISTAAGNGPAGGFSGDGGPATSANLDNITGVTAMPDGGFLIVDRNNERIRRVTPGGTISTVVGGGGCATPDCGDGGPATSARLNTPERIALTPEGDYLIADSFNHRVRFVDAGGTPNPPPPAAPEVKSVDVAGGGVAPGQPGFASVTTNRPVKQINWDFGGDGKVDAVCPGEQSGVRFRSPPSSSVHAADLAKHYTTVTATVIDGNGLVSRAFQVPIASKPAPPLGADISNKSFKQIVAAVDKKPVFVCADPAGFIKVNFNGLISRTTNSPKCVASTVIQGPLRIYGCLHGISTTNDIPKPERDAVSNLLRSRFGVQPGSDDEATKLLDGLITDGPITVNGMKLNPSNSSARIVLNRQLESILSSAAQGSIGGIPLSVRRDFQIDTKGLTSVALGPLQRAAGGLRHLGFFDIDGDVDVKLVGGIGPDAHAEVTTHLTLPDWLGGIKAKTVARVNGDGQFDLNSLSIGPQSFSLGPVGITDLKIDYENGTWIGGLKLCVSDGACIDARPDPSKFPRPGVEIHDDGSYNVFANVNFPSPGLQVGTGVFLNSVGAGLADPPLRLRGAATLTAAVIYSGDLSLVMAFPSAAAPYRLADDGSAGPFPGDLRTRSFNTLTIAAAGTAYVKVPIIDKRVRFGEGYFLYNYPGYVSFAGGLKETFFGVIDIEGGMGGAFNLTTGHFNLYGETKACIADIPVIGDVCAPGSAAVDVSTEGAGGCVSYGIGSAGGGVRWSPHFHIFLWADGCKWSVFKDSTLAKVRAAQVSDTYVVHTKKGDPTREVELRGASGAPQVHVATADGKTLDSSSGPGIVGNDAIRIMRSERLKLTTVAIVNPVPGDHKITLLGGSPAIQHVAEAENQPDAHVKAKVLGHGVRRTLTYDVRERVAQSVTFSDVSPSGSREIGTVNGGGHGKLRFSPGPDTRGHTIVAQFVLAGVPAERLTVAKFKPPSPKLGRVAGVKAKHRRSALQVRWRGVREAKSYQVVATLASGGQVIVSTKRRRATLKGVARWSKGRVTVQALAPLRSGSLGKASFRANGKRHTRFHPLPRKRKRH